MWGKKYFLTIMILCCFLYAYSSDLEFLSIECPKEVFISDDMNVRDLEEKCIIKYKYLGEDFVIKKNDKKNIKENSITFLHKYINVFGEIYYIDDEGRILPCLESCSKEYKKDFGFTRYSISHSYNCEHSIFKNKEIYSLSLSIFDESIFDQTDIDEAILNKTLSAIVIIIEKIKVRWEVDCPEYNSKGKVELDDINRAKIIKIRYKGKK